MVRRTLLALASLAAILAAQARAEERRASILDGSVAVQADEYAGYSVKVDLGAMLGPHIVGRVTASGGTGNDVEVDVFTESDFLNWKNGHDTHPLFASGRATATDLDVPIEHSGTYYVVLSNKFSTLTPKTVEGHIALAWSPLAPSKPPKEERDATNTIMWAGVGIIVCILLVAAGIGGLIVWVVMSRRKKAQTPAAGS